MEDNPYLQLAGLFGGNNGKESAAGLQLGKVTSAPSEEYPDTPLKVSVGGTVQEEDDLLKNAALGVWGFAAGDKVLLLPIEDAQRYIIICKVVSV